MYCNDRNVLNIVSLLKQYGIRKTVMPVDISRIPLAKSILSDDFFKTFQIADERVAAYFATGLSFESEEAIVVVCEGTSACRNYMSALTESFYRGLPIIAIISQEGAASTEALLPRLTDNSNTQLDTRRIFVNLNLAKCEEDDRANVVLINKAILSTLRKGGGPAIISLPLSTMTCETKALPNAQKIDFYTSEDIALNENCSSKLKSQLQDKKIALLIGLHNRFSQAEIETIERFMASYDAAVFCDNNSNYAGRNKVFINTVQLKDKIKPDLIIDIGSVLNAPKLGQWLSSSPCWRISENGKSYTRYGQTIAWFDCTEQMFFRALAATDSDKNNNSYYESILKCQKEVTCEKELTPSYISSLLFEKLPKGCSIQIDVSEKLSAFNSLELDKSINCSTNVGGFGIDGTLSTFIGRSMVSRDKLYFAVVSDTGFYCDINILGNRHKRNNLRILMLNFSDVCSKSNLSPAKAWAETVGIYYMSVKNLQELEISLENFCNPKIEDNALPILLEIII